MVKTSSPGLHLFPEMTFENPSNGCDLAHDLFDAPKSPGVLKEAFHVLPIFVLRQSIPRIGRSVSIYGWAIRFMSGRSLSMGCRS